MKKGKVKRVINWQKIFCFASFVFILVCCLWYGGRFIYFYLDNNKDTKVVAENFGSNIINSNSDSLKNINGTNYFVEDASNNYVRYSNILWRIVKIDGDNNIYLISDNSLTSMAYGKDISDYDKSYVNKWLNNTNDDYSGIIENNLNKVSDYLTSYNVCIDDVDDVSNVSCEVEYNDDYVGLLSIIDYVNTGGSNSFINNGEYSYLSNGTKDNEVWYITSDGKLDKSDGTDTYGVKPVITLKTDVKSNGGDGSKDNPYVIDNEKSLFGGYVKLDKDIWRIYEVNGDNVKLMLNDYLKVDDDNLYYIYSKKNYYHNDTVYGSLAYYLNDTYLDSLSYSDKILSNDYANGYYDSDYDYSKILDTTIDTKVSIISVGNVIFNNGMDGIWSNTGTDETGEMIFSIKKSGNLYSKNVSSKAYVVPCITIDKNILTKGDGTLSSPYEME